MTDTRAPEGPTASSDNDATAAPAASGATTEAAIDPVEAKAQEAAELKNKLLRALAEMENLRRRTEREVIDARLYGIASFARDVLGVADNMRRALETVPPEMRTAADMGINALIDGVELTERELLKVLEKNGVKKFDPLGQKFDPNVHQAMYEVPDDTVPAGTVAQVVQAGYMIGDRMLRPALVAVAKGGPKSAPATPADDSANGDAPASASNSR